MAKTEHLEILSQGVNTWNSWRTETDEQPDLREAELDGAKLHGVDFSGADLLEASLREAGLKSADFLGADLLGADLSGADLQQAYLMRSQLPGACLFGADLSAANLRKANVKSADLRYANLRSANLRASELEDINFRRADLSNVDFQGAIMGGTIFFKTRLKSAKNLDEVRHAGPSNLDHFTIAQSDPLPLSFLRGCGLPDLVINNVEVLRGDAIQFYSCFISYSSENEDFAERLHADLQDEGIRCWFAPHDLRGGRKTHHQINEAIRLHDKLVLILSKASMESNWVEHEIRQARKRERKEDRRVLFPIRLVPYETLQEWTLFSADEGRDLAEEIREYYIPGFTEWKDHDAYREEFEKLVRDLQAAEAQFD